MPGVFFSERVDLHKIFFSTFVRRSLLGDTFFWVKEVAWSMLGSKGFKQIQMCFVFAITRIYRSPHGLRKISEIRIYFLLPGNCTWILTWDIMTNHPPNSQIAYSSSCYYSTEMWLLTAAILFLWSYGGQVTYTARLRSKKCRNMRSCPSDIIWQQSLLHLASS